MKPRNYTRINQTTKIEAGTILIAQPFWKEEMYQRVVILIIEHNSKGTTGIFLNRKSNLLVSEAIPSLEIIKPLYYGGEFQTKIISYVHSNVNVPESIYLGNNIYWGGNFDKVSQMIYERRINPEEINFYAGFTNWLPGQVEDEINENKWWVCELNAHDIFTYSSEELWGEGLEIYGSMYALFKAAPDPSIN